MWHHVNCTMVQTNLPSCFWKTGAKCSGGTSFFHLLSSKFPKMEKAAFSNKLPCLPGYTVSHPRRQNKAHSWPWDLWTSNFREYRELTKLATIMILWNTYSKFWKNKPTQNTTVRSFYEYFTNKLISLNITFLPVVASGDRFWCINHWKLRSSFWPSLCWYIIPYQWRTQEFFSGGGFNKFSWGQRAERTGIWGW